MACKDHEAKHHAVKAAGKIVGIALDMSGSVGMVKAGELERLYRDVRCGRFHPASSALVHELVGNTTLGIGLDEQPRLRLTPTGHPSNRQFRTNTHLPVVAPSKVRKASIAWSSA